jgi:Glycosyl hydrolases family 16
MLISETNPIFCPRNYFPRTPMKPTRLSNLFILCLSVLSVGPAVATAQNPPLGKTAKEVQSASDTVPTSSPNSEGTANVPTAGQVPVALQGVTEPQDKPSPPLETPVDPFAKGHKYPKPANVSIESFDVPVGATVVHIPVTLDRQSPNTVVAHIRVSNGTGGRANPDTTKALIFRPGDPLTKTVSFAVNPLKEGDSVRAVQSSVPDGGVRRGGGIVITAKAGAINEPLKDAGRAPLKFSPLGELRYSVDGATIQFDDKGGPNSFSTALSHGRVQVGNRETGYYGKVEMGGFIRTAEGLVLSTRRLKEPVMEGSPPVAYPFLAVMLSGHRTPETHFKYGSIEWVVKMPNRRGSWPALWLLPPSGWPPEIDVYEGFGYNESWKFHSDLSTNIHGGSKLTRSFTRPTMHIKMSSFGLADTLTTEFHVFAATVDPDWITLFVDGVETIRYANPFRGRTWYPLTNVAVKAKVDSSYSDGSGDMVLRSLKVWRSE